MLVLVYPHQMVTGNLEIMESSMMIIQCPVLMKIVKIYLISKQFLTLLNSINILILQECGQKDFLKILFSQLILDTASEKIFLELFRVEVVLLYMVLDHISQDAKGKLQLQTLKNVMV